MDEPGEDDIYILKHEKADSARRRDADIPISVYTGDESVASHFALVTAYEDIKKRLKETEKENSVLKKRVRVLEEKLLGSRLEEETRSVGCEQVNKAYQAYREACIDRENLKSKLDKMVKDNAESLKILNEQLQSKEVELLQLRTEVETQQVMRNLNCSSSSWEIEKLNSDLKVHNLEQDLEKLKKECNSLRKELQKFVQKNKAQEGNQFNGDLIQRRNFQSENVQQAYWDLKREMSNLHLVTEMQAQVLRKLKTNPTATKKGKLVFAAMGLTCANCFKLHYSEDKLSTPYFIKISSIEADKPDYIIVPAYPFSALPSVSYWSTSHIKVLLMCVFFSTVFCSPCGFFLSQVLLMCTRLRC